MEKGAFLARELLQINNSQIGGERSGGWPPR